ncbi:MAG: hypothetical protein HY240_01540 [Actinobacteria bacterium]|nr:hypothetical protein [Actinomycetota bacterium]
MEVIVHDVNLPTAQAIIVEHTGDLSLLQASDDDYDGDDGYDRLVTVRAFEAGAQAARVRDAGIPVRVEFPDEDIDGAASGMVTLYVPKGSLDEARELLGISL